MVVTGGDYAYIATGYNGVRIVDFSNPSHPVEVGAYPIDAIITQLKLDGNRLYAGCFGPSGAWGDYVLDVSNPTQPKFISFGQWCGECHGIDAVGNIGYFADTNGVRIVDFSDPGHPQQLFDKTADNQQSGGSCEDSDHTIQPRLYIALPVELWTRSERTGLRCVLLKGTAYLAAGLPPARGSAAGHDLAEQELPGVELGETEQARNGRRHGLGDLWLAGPYTELNGASN